MLGRQTNLLLYLCKLVSLRQVGERSGWKEVLPRRSSRRPTLVTPTKASRLIEIMLQEDVAGASSMDTVQLCGETASNPIEIMHV
jgi:hypothetical protein